MPSTHGLYQLTSFHGQRQWVEVPAALSAAAASALTAAAAAASLGRGRRPARRGMKAVGPGGLHRAELREVEGKGLGVVAVEAMAAGEQVLAEPPLLLFDVAALDSRSGAALLGLRSTGRPPGGMEAQLRRRLDEECSEEQRAAFWELCDSFTPAVKSAAGIFLSNSFDLGAGSSCGVFAAASRFNHSCVPSVVRTWQDSGCMVFRTSRPVPAGEELTITYCALDEPAAERQAAVSRKWNFGCRCPRCSLPPVERWASDMQRRKLRALDGLLNFAGWAAASFGQPWLAALGLGAVDELAATLDEELEGNAEWKAWAYYYGLRLAALAGDGDRMAALRALGLRQARLAQGARGPLVQLLEEGQEP